MLLCSRAALVAIDCLLATTLEQKSDWLRQANFSQGRSTNRGVIVEKAKADWQQRRLVECVAVAAHFHGHLVKVRP